MASTEYIRLAVPSFCANETIAELTSVLDSFFGKISGAVGSANSFVDEIRETTGIVTDIMQSFSGQMTAFLEDKLVGCATLQVDSREGCKYRIRGMAVEPNFRNQGIGTKIVNKLQEYARREDTGIWCNARIKAINMYERCGFKIISEVFEIKPIGLHYDMEWKS